VITPPGFQPRKFRSEWTRSDYQLPFDFLHATFSGLRKLHVSLEGEMLFPAESPYLVEDVRAKLMFEAREDAVYGAVDAFVRALAAAGSRLGEVFVSVDSTFWRVLCQQSKSSERTDIQNPPYPGMMFWRAVDSTRTRGISQVVLGCGCRRSKVLRN
ncbi:hypothetical protein C8A00DRAFT_17338, partial [Chaetomidium leptoderma]